MRQLFRILRTYVLQLFILTFLGFSAWSQTAATAPAEQGGNKSSDAGSSDYVGTEVCVTCHAEQQKSFVHTIMGNAMAHPKTDGEAWAANPVTDLAGPTWRQAAERTLFRSASPRIPPPQSRNEMGLAFPAIPREIRCSGEAVRTSRGRWLAWTATRSTMAAQPNAIRAKLASFGNSATARPSPNM